MRIKAGETTYGDLETRLEDAANGLALYMLNDIMDDIEEETGIRPHWDDLVPQDVLDVFYCTGRADISGADADPDDEGYTWLK